MSKKTLSGKLRGVNTAVLTPYNEKGLQIKEFANFLKRQKDNNIASITVCGTTGEGALLSQMEKTAVIKQAVEIYGDCVIVNAGEIQPKRTIENCIVAQNAGASAALVITPYYTTTTQQGIIDYYTYVNRKTDLPVIAYNVPARTGFNIETETVLTLMKNGVIQGIKQANGDVADSAFLSSNGLAVFCGDDNLAPLFSALSARGCISVVSNVYPKLMVQNTELKNGKIDLEKYQDLLQICRLFFASKNPIATKYFAYKNRLISEYFLRLPLCKISAELQSKIDVELTNFEKYL